MEYGGKELLALTGDGNVTSVAWSHDGKRLAAGVGTRLKVWDARNGLELLALPADGSINSVAWNQDDTRLIGGDSEGTVHVYALNIRDLMALARRRVTRPLSHDECRVYLHTANCTPIPDLRD